MLTRITDRKIPGVYIHVYRITKKWGPVPYNSLRHADNAKSKGSAHVLLGEGSGKIWTCSCWEKGNFIMINEFKYGQTWKIWPSPLYSTFKPRIDRHLLTVCSFSTFPVCINLFMLLFLVTAYLVMAAQPCMEWILNNNKNCLTR